MESIQLTGNKPTFNNYLTDPMILPINAKVCLNKASFAIPVWTQQFVEMPIIVDTEYNNVMFVVELNGVSIQISWQDFYNAWNNLTVIEVQAIEDFYDGNYKFYFNNLIYWVSTTNTLNTIATFTEVLARAINDNFDFFDISSSDIIINGVRTDINQNDSLTINGIVYFPYTSNLQIKALQIVSEYNPSKNWATLIQPMSTENNSAFTAINDVTITNNNVIGSTIDFTTASGVYGSIAVCEESMDPNCGVWQFKPDITDTGNMVATFVFDSQYMDFNSGLTEFAENNIQVGIKFRFNDGVTSYCFYDNITHDSGMASNVKYPTDDAELLLFNSNIDYFFITSQRAPDYDTSGGKYVFKFYKSDGNDANINNASLMWSTTYNVHSPGMAIFPLALSDNATSTFSENKFVAITADSLSMNKATALASNKAFTIRPLPDSVLVDSLFYQHEFFDSIGLYQNEDDSNLRVSYDSAPMSNKIKWTTGKIKKRYFIGVNNINKIFTGAGAFLDLKAGSSALPRQMEVSLLNTSHTPHTGSFAQEVLFTEPDINKVISYINTSADDFNTDNNLYLEYVYEAFNIVCRRLKNRSKLPLNNFQIKIGYKDFITNEEKIIDALQGICKLEILFEGEDDQH